MKYEGLANTLGKATKNHLYTQYEAVCETWGEVDATVSILFYQNGVMYANLRMIPTETFKNVIITFKIEVFQEDFV